MKQAAKVMYTIGKIFNIIGIVCLVIAIGLMIFGIVCSDQVFQIMQEHNVKGFDTPEEVKTSCIEGLVGSIFGLLIAIAILVLAVKARKSIDSENKTLTPHVIMIVIGAFGDIFYLLGGVFGLIAKNNDEQQAFFEERLKESKK